MLSLDVIKNTISNANSGYAPSIKLDDKTDVRVCLASDICLCQIESANGRRIEKEFLYLRFTTIYIPQFDIYLTRWAIHSGSCDKHIQHRLEVIEWNGGLPITLRITEHLSEAIDDCIRILTTNKYDNNSNYIIIPLPEFRSKFIDAGWLDG